MAVLGIATACRAQSVGGAIFDVGGLRAQRAVVTVADTPVPEVETLKGTEPGMLGALAGVLAELQGKSLNDLRACAPPNPFMGDAGTGDPLCVIHLWARDPRRPGVELSKRVAIHRGPDGAYVAVELDPGESRPRRAELRREAFTALMTYWPRYRGGFDGAAGLPVGIEPFELTKPYEVGRFVINEKTLSERFVRGGKPGIPAAERVLDNEKLFVRVPAGYDARRPAGLVVWIDPSMSGVPPEPLAAALDEYGMICVGAAGAGNARLVTDRYQLVFDGVATICKRFHVDPRRVYLTGVSGGGRVSSILLACFPDEFAGAVPIVGLSCYQQVPNGVGKFWPAAYSRPGSEIFNIFRSRRMAPMTGQKDFNQIEMQHATDIMQRHGVNIRLFDYPDMAHTLPRPDRFQDALGWVDAPYRALRHDEEEAAAKAMDVYIARHGDAPPADEAARNMLTRVTQAGPWTAPAWRAAELLGAVGTRAKAASLGEPAAK